MKAGFAGPAEEEANDQMSLEAYLVDQPNSTFFVRVKGDHMHHVGILNGDIAITQRKAEVSPGQTVVMNEEGDIKLKTFVAFDEHGNDELLGVVTGIARKYGHS